MESIQIFTDGSSRGNPGYGGWGVVMYYDGKILELGGRSNRATNSEMELEAILRVLQKCVDLKLNTRSILIHSDSEYAVNTFSDWVYKWEANNWRRKGWKGSGNKKIKNLEIIQEIHAIKKEIEKVGGEVKFVHVNSHVGISGNERADEIATKFADNNDISLFEGEYEEYTKIFGEILLNK